MATNTEAMSFKNMNFVNTVRDKILSMVKSNYKLPSDFTNDQLWVIISSTAPANVPNDTPFISTEYCDPTYTAGELGYLITGWQFNLDLEYMVISAQTEKDYGRILNELVNEGWKEGLYNTPPSKNMYTHYNDVGPLVFATINPILRYLLTACRFHQATLECPRSEDNPAGHDISSERWRKLKSDYVREVCGNFNKLTELYNTDKMYVYQARMETESYSALTGNGTRIVVDFSVCNNPTRQMSFEFRYPPEFPKTNE